MQAKTIFMGFIALVAVPLFAVPKNDAILAGPAALAISLNDGKGAGTFSLLISKDIEGTLALDYTPAISATGDTIERTAIGVPKALAITKDSSPRVVQVTISVTTPQRLAANTPYIGKVFIFTDERQEISFTITQPVATSFDVDPKTITTHLAVGDNGQRLMRVRSTSAIPLQRVEISSTGFTNSRGSSIPYAPAESLVDIKGNSETAQVQLPYPRYAGTYIGVVDVIGPNSDKQSVNVTFTVRGPFGKRAVPLVLFVVVLLLGFFLSLGLENLWSERRIEELEIERELSRARLDISSAIALLIRWADAGAPLPKTRFAFISTQDSIEQVLETIRQIPLVQLRQHAADATNVARAARAFVAEMGKIPPAKDVANRADAVPIASADYRTELRKAISNADVENAIELKALPPRTPDDVTHELRTIRTIRSTIVLLVVALTAYQTFFYPDLQFGAAVDYIKVFVWSLGFTQAGTQIIARIRSMPT